MEYYHRIPGRSPSFSNSLGVYFPAAAGKEQGSEWSDRSSPEEKTDWSVKKGVED